MDLLKKIEEEGRQQGEQILAEAEAQIKVLGEQAERELQAWQIAYRTEQEARIEQERRLRLTRARAQAQEALIRAKGRAAAALFERLAQEAAGLREDQAAYRTFLQRSLQETERALPGPLQLRADPRDQELLGKLIKGSPHRLGEPQEMLGGFIATNERGDTVIDNRLQARIENLRARFRSRLGPALFGEAEPTQVQVATRQGTKREVEEISSP